jgi:hypothetical protein
MTSTELTIKMRDLLDGKQDGKAYDYIRNEWGHIIVNAIGQVKGRKRTRGFSLPSLDHARRTWEGVTAQRVEWPADRDDEAQQPGLLSRPDNVPGYMDDVPTPVDE